MKILITYSSRHGATEEIAIAIYEEIAKRYNETHLKEVGKVGDISGFDVVILGSAVYAGSWRRDAATFASENKSQLKKVKLWTFSSGPVGEPKENQKIEPIGPSIIKLMEELKPMEHKIFSGNLDKSKLNFAEKGIIKIVKATYGDYRDFDEIRSWATSISHELTKSQR
jgi:menaquinone-dependent protoporphyrinogen oxidase